MLFQWLRLIYSDNGVISDLSIENQDESVNVSLELHATEDYLYIGQHFPFNNFFLQVSTANTVTNAISMDYWVSKSTGWYPVVDILDGTRASGKALAKSGVVQFSPDNQFTWGRVGDAKGETLPTGLSTVKVYNMYWLRIKWSVLPSAGTAMKRLAYAFTRHQQLDNLDAQINSYLGSFAVGKTSWDDEIVTASMQVLLELKRRGLVVTPGNILRFDDVTHATDWKALILIYQNLGPAFRQKLIDAQAEFTRALDLTRFSFDADDNALLSYSEIANSVAKLVR